MCPDDVPSTKEDRMTDDRIAIALVVGALATLASAFILARREEARAKGRS